MMQRLILVSALFLVVQPLQAIAQIIPDNSLGGENSVVVPNQNIRGIESDRIDGGAIRGSNLFHSFQEFNIDNGRGAYFSTPENISNILSRVTGNNLSNILGRLGVLGNANLFLINPNGIVFGPNARLDVGGAFFASTADGILFENGVEFAASNPEAPPLLTINIPIGLNFRENPGTIVNQASHSVGLQVQPRNTLGLIGGDIYLEGGLITAQAGQIELGSVASNSLVQLIPTATGFALGYERVNNFQDIFLSSGAIVDATGEKAGNIQIQGRNLIVDQSKIKSITQGNEQGGTLTVRTSESVQLTGLGNSQYQDHVREPIIAGNINDLSTLEVSGLITGTQAEGNAASISIETPLLRLQEGAALFSPTVSLGAAGNIDVRASQVEIIGSSLFAPAIPNSAGAAGNITINTGSTGSLTIQNDGELYNSTFGRGAAGNITINSGDVEVTHSLLSTASAFEISGSAGDIAIDANWLSIRDTGVLGTTTSGNGTGGDITIRASESVEILGTGIDSLKTLGDSTFDEVVDFDLLTLRPVTETPNRITETPNRITGLVAGTQKGLGNAGEIIISTPLLRLDNGALISSPTLGQGNAGEININASNIEITASQLFTAAAQNSTGVAGDVNISTQELVLRDRGAIFSPTAGVGDSGQITIDASNVEIINSLITTAAANSSKGGNAGDITITTDQLTLSNTGTIVSGTANIGQGGDIIVRASESIELIGSGADKAQQAREGVLEPPSAMNERMNERRNVLTIQDGFVAATEGTGNAGNITIETPLLRLRNGAVIFSPTRGGGRGGDITVTASIIELVSSIITSAAAFDATGEAGNINIHTEQLRIQDSGEIVSSTFGQGDGGNISITSSDSDVTRSFITTASTSTSTGEAGDIRVNTGQLTVRDTSVIQSATASPKDAGDVTVFASESIELVGNGLDNYRQVREDIWREPVNLLTIPAYGIVAGTQQNDGNAGNIRLETPSLRLLNGATVLSPTLGAGEGGNIIIDASQVEITSSGLVTLTAVNSTGNAGNVTIETEQLKIQEEAEIFSPTFGEGLGGNIDIDASDIEIIRSQLTTTAADNSMGTAGTINLETETLTVQDQSTIGVNSLGSGEAGNLTIEAHTLRLDNQATLTAETRSGEGNIIFNGQDLIMSDNSEITTNAQGNVPGGNIIIDTENLAALSNSDISANAEEAFGGRVTINATGVFGTEFREQQTSRSDITATSELGPEFSGTVELNTEVDPSSGLIELSQNVVNPNDLIAAEFCRQRGGSEFVVTGKGGLAVDPNDKATGDQIEVDLVEPVPSRPQNSSQKRSEINDNQPISSLDIIPARGWIRDENGDVILVSYDPTKTGIRRQPVQPPQCQP